MKKFYIVDHSIIDNDGKILISSDNNSQLNETYQTIISLQNLLYLDSLGCYTKFKLNETLNEKKWNFVYIDVNNLKKTNDTYGHFEGDKLLKKVVIELGRYGQVFRQGGDEFVLLIDDDAKLNQFIEDNSQNKLFSYGVCEKDEYENINQAFVIADKRMFKQKNKKHHSYEMQ